MEITRRPVKNEVCRTSSTEFLVQWVRGEALNYKSAFLVGPQIMLILLILWHHLRPLLQTNKKQENQAALRLFWNTTGLKLIQSLELFICIKQLPKSWSVCFVIYTVGSDFALRHKAGLLISLFIREFTSFCIIVLQFLITGIWSAKWSMSFPYCYSGILTGAGTEEYMFYAAAGGHIQACGLTLLLQAHKLTMKHIFYQLRNLSKVRILSGTLQSRELQLKESASNIFLSGSLPTVILNKT